MAPKKSLSDAYLAKGVVAIIKKHAVTGDDVQDTLTIANYPATKPGITSFAKDVLGGAIDKEAHGDKSLQDLAQFAFFDRLSKKRDDPKEFINEALATIDDSIKSAQKEAQLNAWRIALDAHKSGNTQKQARGLYKELSILMAKRQELDATIANAKSELAKELDLDTTFDIALVDTGWYIASKTKAQGKGKKMRAFEIKSYEVTRVMRGTKVKSIATVKSLDADNVPDNVDVTYTVLDGKHKGKKFDGTGDTLNQADSIARTALMDALDLPGVRANNAPEWYKVPEVNVK